MVEMDVDVNGVVVDRLGRRRMWRKAVAVRWKCGAPGEGRNMVLAAWQPDRLGQLLRGAGLIVNLFASQCWVKNKFLLLGAEMDNCDSSPSGIEKRYSQWSRNWWFGPTKIQCQHVPSVDSLVYKITTCFVKFFNVMGQFIMQLARSR